MTLPTSPLLPARDEQWLTAVTALLRELAQDGFTFHLCGTPDPVALVASYYWDDYVDLLTITGPAHATAARAVREESFTVFHPPALVWAFGSDVEPSLRALLNLVSPEHPGHPDQPFATPPSMILPEEVRQSVRVKPPAPSQAQRRAQRYRQALRNDAGPIESAVLGATT